MPNLSDGYAQVKRTSNNSIQNFICHQSCFKSYRPHISGPINQILAVDTAEFASFYSIFADKSAFIVVLSFTSKWVRCG